MDRGFYRGVFDFTGGVLMYFAILSIGSAILSAALLGALVIWFIAVRREMKK